MIFDLVLQSESGTFIMDGKGIVQSFHPSDNNPYVIEETEIKINKSHYTYKTNKTISTLIVPEKVKGFCSEFMRDVRIKDRLVLPDTLLSIGTYCPDNLDDEQYCVFANTILPDVIIPSNVKSIGKFAFGKSVIKSLSIPLDLKLSYKYARQFGASYIEELRLPIEWENKVSIDKYGRLETDSSIHNIITPFCYVERLVFYPSSPEF